MTRRILLPVCLVAALGACAEVSDPTSRPDAGAAGAADAGTSAADELLRSSGVAAAQAAYEAQLTANPSDPRAAFGSALTRTLQLPDDPAITRLLDLCKQPRFNVNAQVFGPDGVFAQDRENRRGTGSFTLFKRQGLGTASPVAFQPDTYRSAVHSEATRAGTERSLSVRITDVGYAGGSGAAELSLHVRFARANAEAPGVAARPLADGLELSAEEFGGEIYFGLPSADGLVWDSFYHPVSGSIVFRSVGSGAAGDAVAIEFKNLVLEGSPGYCEGSCIVNDWPYLTLSGSFADTVTIEPQLALPFEDLVDDAGPPYRAALVVLVEQCPGLSAEYLRERLLELLQSVQVIGDRLGVVVKAPNAEAFQFRVPAGLVYADGEIPLNITDVRIAKTAVDLALALGHGVTQYRTFAARFEQLLGTYLRWVDLGDGPTTREERGFIARLVLAELNQVFLDREPGFDLSKARLWLLAALDDAAAALSRAPKSTGVFNFQTPNSRALAADFGDQILFLRTSLQTTGLQPFPHSPDWSLSLKSVFDAPVDLQALRLASTGGQGVFVLRAADPLSAWAEDRNESIEVDGEGVKRALAPVFARPPDLSSRTCGPLEPCPGRYRCIAEPGAISGHCQEPGLVFLEKGPIQQAIPSSGDPAFFNSAALRPLQVLDF